MPDIVVSLTPAQMQRVVKAFGQYWAKPGDATPEEVKVWLVRQLKGVVRQQERGAAEAALPEPAELQVT